MPIQRSGHNGKEESNEKLCQIKGYEDIPINNEKSLLKAAGHQPVSASDRYALQFYVSGVFTSECRTCLDQL